MARGNHGHPIFRGDQDRPSPRSYGPTRRRRWLGILGEACIKTGWRVHAFVLMGNHSHLLLETPKANPVAGMKCTACPRRGGGRVGADAGMRVLGLSAEELRALPKGAAEKAVLAGWLRRQTTVTLRRVGERLDLGHYTRVTQAVSRVERRPSWRVARLRDCLRRSGDQETP